MVDPPPVPSQGISLTYNILLALKPVRDYDDECHGKNYHFNSSRTSSH